MKLATRAPTRRRTVNGSPATIARGEKAACRSIREQRTMVVPEKQRRTRWVTFLVEGSLAGGLFGILSGPIAIFADMWLEHHLHGTTFLGLELLAGPIVGAVLGALEGAGFAAIWVSAVARPRRLTIARLMLIVAIAGPSLAL